MGYDTPDSIPDVFGQAQSTNLGGITGAGFRVAGASGLANIASMLGASGITFKHPINDDSDDEDEEGMHIMGQNQTRSLGKDKFPEGSGGKADRNLDNKALDNGSKPVDFTEPIVSKLS